MSLNMMGSSKSFEAKLIPRFCRSNSFFLFLIMLFIFGISGCASSNVSREAASNVDMGVQNAKNLASSSGGDPVQAFQNSTQATKGAILGGAAGAVVGSLPGGIGAIPIAATGVILGASYGSYLDTETSLEDKLLNRNVSVVTLGDQILIVLYSPDIFEYLSARVKPQAYSTLQLVAKYISQYPNMLVKVGAYTTDTGSRRVDLALSMLQARNVAKMLSESGINTRVLYAMGYGGSKLVSPNVLDWDGNDNYRIEITLEKLYV